MLLSWRHFPARDLIIAITTTGPVQVEVNATSIDCDDEQLALELTADLVARTLYDASIPLPLCAVCNGDEQLTELVWRNGEEVDESEPCPECCTDARETDRDRREYAADMLYDQDRDDRMIGGAS